MPAVGWWLSGTTVVLALIGPRAAPASFAR